MLNVRAADRADGGYNHERGDSRHKHPRRNRQETTRSSRLRRPPETMGGRALLRLDQPKQAIGKGFRGHHQLRRSLPLRRICHDPPAAPRKDIMSFEADSYPQQTQPTKQRCPRRELHVRDTCSSKFSDQELRNSGAMKSKPSAATTRIVARTSPALTIRLGSGRAQASPSAQASREDR